MTINRPLIVIPARLRSSRLKNKLLLPLHGRPIIHWVCRRIQSSGLADFVIATDSEIIREYCYQNDFDCLLTPDHFENGTERVAYIAKHKSEYDFFVNVQADEPLLNISLVENVIFGFKSGALNVAVSKLSESYINNTNEVKAALSFANRIRFASRSSVPFGRDEASSLYKIHGVYSYDVQTLTRFLNAPAGPLEDAEKVEQLRCIEHDIPIYAVPSECTEISVDTQADYDYMLSLPKSKFEEFL